MLSVLFLHSCWRAGNYPMTKDSISNYRTKVKCYNNASSPVNRVCGRIPRIPPESATDFMCMVACPERIIIQAYSFETVYCMNFIIFLCLILKLFSFSFVPLLVPTSDLSFSCFRQQLKTFLFCKYWHQSQHYFSALETSFMRSTNLWYLLTYLHKHDTSLSGATQSQTTQIGQVGASPRSACQIQRQTDSHDVSDDDDDDDTDNSL